MDLEAGTRGCPSGVRHPGWSVQSAEPPRRTVGKRRVPRDLCEEVGRLVVQHRLFRLEEVDPALGVRGLVGEPVLADQTGYLGESGSDLVTDRFVFRSSDALQVEIDDQDVHFVSSCVGACDESESG